MRVRILGCGTSTGVPKIGNHWGECDPNEPRNRRLRSSILVTCAGERMLVDCGPEGAELAETLGDVRDMPLSRLFFGKAAEGAGQDEAVLSVITMAGLTLPDLTIDREYWQLEERMALPMLHLATAFTTRRAYGLGMAERKIVGLDETHFLAGWGSGRALFTRLARDSRKWNIAALAAMLFDQTNILNPHGFLGSFGHVIDG